MTNEEWGIEKSRTTIEIGRGEYKKTEWRLFEARDGTFLMLVDGTTVFTGDDQKLLYEQAMECIDYWEELSSKL